MSRLEEHNNGFAVISLKCNAILEFVLENNSTKITRCNANAVAADGVLDQEKKSYTLIC